MNNVHIGKLNRERERKEEDTKTGSARRERETIKGQSRAPVVVSPKKSKWQKKKTRKWAPHHTTSAHRLTRICTRKQLAKYKSNQTGAFLLDCMARH